MVTPFTDWINGLDREPTKQTPRNSTEVISAEAITRWRSFVHSDQVG
jgi:hypothetical protein